MPVSTLLLFMVVVQLFFVLYMFSFILKCYMLIAVACLWDFPFMLA